jgi:aminopeptidase-like protein
MIMDAGDNLYSPNYLPQDIGAAMEWLSNHGTPEDTVAAPPGLAILIPMMAGRRQILRLEDHGGYQESRTKLEWIFDESLDADPVELVTVLKMNRVRYIMLGPTCDPDTKRRYMEHLTTGGAAARVYSNDTVWILEVGGMNR